jgi:hypothetical protein
MRFVPVLVAAFVAAGSFAGDASAAAKKKLTYEEAYAKCKTVLDKEGALGTSTQANERHTRGAACMKKYGHKL